MDITKLCESEESFYAFDKVWKEEMSTPKAWIFQGIGFWL